MKLVGLETAVAAAHDSAVIVDRPGLGYLRFTGETRLDLIHRMSTQQVNGLQPGQGTATILTTDIGRIIDRLLLYAGENELLAVTGAGNNDNVARYLMRFVFFQDDFHVADLSPQTAFLAVYGRQAEDRLSVALGFGLALPMHHWREVTWRGLTFSVHRTDPVAGAGYLLICRSHEQETLRQELIAERLVPASADAFEYLRIESGLPLFGSELTGEYIPLEAGLWEDVSFTKGCYIGQEIIARMESRNRIAKKLALLQPAEMVAAGATIMADNRQAGQLTSIANGPRGPLALGYIRTSFLEQETPIAFSADGTKVALLDVLQR
jgi:aminomethyltransferase